MCDCKQIKRVAKGPLGNFEYTFECVQPPEQKRIIKINSTNDIQAKLLAEMECNSDDKGK
jgi:hypothetical protein